MQSSFKINERPGCRVKIHIGLSLDFKNFDRLKKDGLALQSKISFYLDDYPPEHFHIFLELFDTNSPFTTDKGARNTAKLLVKFMTETGIWEYRNKPSLNLSLDGGISFPIIKYLQKLGWERADESIITCEGHNGLNMSGLGSKFLKWALDNDQHLGKSLSFLPRY